LEFLYLGVVFLLLMVFVTVGVAFVTLLQCEVLGYIHVCKGRDRMQFVGIFQPFGDAIKLFTGEQYFPLVSNYFVFYFSPVLGVFLPLLVWVLVPYLSGFISLELGFCCFFLLVLELVCNGCWLVFQLWLLFTEGSSCFGSDCFI
jgi:NADH-ubiquinone oxidoreductase chain 1